MSLSVGIVGLPNVGKSTLFNSLLSRRMAPVGAHPFTTVKPNTGVVRVSDTRLEKLTRLIKPAKSTAATVTFVDIAGLVKGAHKGEGLGNEFLSQIRGVDVICHVVREFSDMNVEHVMGSVDPLRDREVIRTELGLKDLETLERAKVGKRLDRALQSAIEKLITALNADKPTTLVKLSKDEGDAVHHIQLLTSKPVFYVLNVAEEDLEELKVEVKKLAGRLKNCVVVCAKLEEELIDFDEKERVAYRKEVGIRGSGLDRVIAKAHDLLNLLTFYTVKGAGSASAKPARRQGKATARQGEVRAWSIGRGLTAIEAASKVHSDFAKHFVKAYVISVDELLKFEGWKQAKEKGKIRREGKGYVVKDGDVVEFKVSG